MSHALLRLRRVCLSPTPPTIPQSTLPTDRLCPPLPRPTHELRLPFPTKNFCPFIIHPLSSIVKEPRPPRIKHRLISTRNNLNPASKDFEILTKYSSIPAETYLTYRRPRDKDCREAILEGVKIEDRTQQIHRTDKSEELALRKTCAQNGCDVIFTDIDPVGRCWYPFLSKSS